MNIKNDSKTAFKIGKKPMSTIEFEEIAQALMNLIDENEIDLEPKMCIHGLKIFRRLIELENKYIHNKKDDENG